MAKQTITLGLSQKSVEKALKQLRQYKQWLRNKTTELVKALAEVGIPVVETNIADASYTFDSISSDHSVVATFTADGSGGGDSCTTNGRPFFL